MRFSYFYERYWQNENGSPADHGYDMAERKRMLQSSLRWLTHGAFVLDAGCGNGEFTHYMMTLGHPVISIDISQTAVKKACRSYNYGHFGVSSLEEGLPFQDNTLLRHGQV